MESILKMWFTPSGAAITFCLVFLIVSLCAFFSTSAQRLLFQILAKGVRGKWGAGEIELGRPVPSKSTGDLPTGEAAPTPPVDDAEPPGLGTSLAPPSASDGCTNNSESALHYRMLIASVSRDHDELDKAYQALMSLPDRQDSDEVVTTYKLSLEHRMGDETAARKLARLADANPNWYEPCQSLASIYYSLGSYDKASTYLTEATKRAQNSDQKLRLLLLDARMREKTDGAGNAIHFLRSSLAAFPEQHNQSKIWEQIAELHINQQDTISSFVAAEIALEMQPLNKNLRFQLAHRYAEDQSTMSLAYYHYDKLRGQDYQYPSCLNNLAIVFGDLDMAAAYVTTLKRAKEFDQPYPHGNLAIALAKAGFLDEAKAMIEEIPEALRLETRAAEAANLIRQRQSDEAKKMEKLERASGLFHKVYLTAANGVQRNKSLDPTCVLGVWTSKLWELSLEEGPDFKGMSGILKRGDDEHRARLKLVSNILSGEARPKSDSIGLFSTTYRMLLAPKERSEMTGIIYSDEMNPIEVTLVRRD